MKVQMKMPDLATNEGVEISVLKWLIEPGQAVKRGEPLLEIETDKAVQEVECITNGTLVSVAVEAGESIGVGEVIAEIEVGGAAALAPVQETPAPVQETPAAPVERKEIPNRSGGMFARRRAKKEE